MTVYLLPASIIAFIITILAKYGAPSVTMFANTYQMVAPNGIVLFTVFSFR